MSARGRRCGARAGRGGRARRAGGARAGPGGRRPAGGRAGASAPAGPAPHGMRVPPSAADLLDVPTWGWHRMGVDLPRQRTLRAAATVASRLEECVDLAPAAALARLRVVPGIGQWTAAEVAQRALGDADAVS